MRVGVVNDRAVLVADDASVDVYTASAGRFAADLSSLFEVWDDFCSWATSVCLDGAPVSPSSLQAPIAGMRQVFGVGLNYRSHVGEVGGDSPDGPMIFTKFPTCLTGPADQIALPSGSVDWEVELVAVIGRAAYRVAEGVAWNYVAGLTVGQDLTDRVVQMAGPMPQFALGKSYPGFGPVGPILVTPDEFPDADDLALGCAVDGEVMQTGRTSDLIFGVPELISRLSNVCPLLPGDLIFTGTPAGVGFARTPSVFLKPGQMLTSWVEGVGELNNPIAAGPDYNL